MHSQKVKNWEKLPELKRLLELTTPPKELYFQGSWNPDLFKNCTAIVGSRKMTDYGARVIEKIIPSLVSSGRTIVSGFMYGVDQYAHKICLANGGRTIAVLGWGINSPLTGADYKLAKDITASGGLLLSEWEAVKAAHWTFPARNRIVAALSEELIVAEAAEKSGSLITAAISVKLKRKVWAVPGPITSRTSKGTNKLIADGKAQMWTGDFILQTAFSSQEDPLLEMLLDEALSADEIARKLNLPVSETGARLSLLLLSEKIIEKGGKYYIADVN